MWFDTDQGAQWRWAWAWEWATRLLFCLIIIGHVVQWLCGFTICCMWDVKTAGSWVWHTLHAAPSTLLVQSVYVYVKDVCMSTMGQLRNKWHITGVFIQDLFNTNINLLYNTKHTYCLFHLCHVIAQPHNQHPDINVQVSKVAWLNSCNHLYAYPFPGFWAWWVYLQVSRIKKKTSHGACTLWVHVCCKCICQFMHYDMASCCMCMMSMYVLQHECEHECEGEHEHVSVSVCMRISVSMRASISASMKEWVQLWYSNSLSTGFSLLLFMCDFLFFLLFPLFPTFF